MCYLFVLAGVAFSTAAFAQAKQDRLPAERENSLAVFSGMGINLTSAPDVVDYLNSLSVGAAAGEFATTVEFFGGVEFPLESEWGGKVEYAYMFKSYSVTGNAGNYTLFYDIHMPMLLGQYIVPGRGYFVKLGAGMGYHSGAITQTYAAYGTDSTFTTTGVGVKLEIVGQTAFDEHLFGYIGGDMRWEFLGKVKGPSGSELQNGGIAASLSLFALGIRFGLVYYI